MTTHRLQGAIGTVAAVQQYGNGWLVDTTCLFPSGKVIQVLIEGTDAEAVVSDAGMTLDELAVSGIVPDDGTAALARYARQMGVQARNGQIFESRVSVEDVPAVIRLVAAAAQDAARNLMHNLRPRPSRHIRDMLEGFIQTKYDSLFEKAVLEGKNKSHQFDYVHVSKANIIAINPVTRDASSRDSRIVSCLDVKSKMGKKFQPVLVYDESEDWSGDEIGMLQLAASAVPFGSIEIALPDLLH